MFYYYRPTTKEIVMQSEGKLKTDLPYFEHTPTVDERDKIKKNYLQTFKDGIINFEEPEHLKVANKKQTMEDLKRQLAGAKDLATVKNIVLSLFDNI